MPQLPIGDIGPCEVTWDYGGANPIVITPHLGTVTVRMSDAVTDVHKEPQGAAPVEAFFEGATVELEVPMARSTLSQLKNTIGYDGMGNLVGNVLMLYNIAGIELYAQAKAIVIKPMLNVAGCAVEPDPDPNHWLVFYKCHPYRDFELGYDRTKQRVHMVKFKVFANQDSGHEGEYFQEGVTTCPPSPLLTRRYLDPAWFVAYKALCIFEDKLCIWDHGPNANDGQLLQTVDGVNWTQLFTRTGAQIGNTGAYDGMGMAVYNDNLFITKYAAANARVIEWDGANITLHLNPPPEQQNYMASNLVVWDDKLWAVLDVTPFQNDHRRVVYYYNGISWVAIINYDGALFLNYNRNSNLPQYYIKHRTTRLFVFNDELYLIATRYTGTKWAWEVWKFNAALGDRFEQLYDSDVFEDGYALAAIIEFEGNIKIVGNELQANGNPGHDCKLYTSSDMVTWALEATVPAIGFPYGEELFQPVSGEYFCDPLPLRIYLNCVNVFPNDLKTWIRYWDEDAGLFTLEQEIATNANTYGGGLRVFKNALYAGKYMEVYGNG